MDQVQEQQRAPTEQPRPSALYVICNTSRARHTRAARAGLPQNPRMKQYVGSMQQRLVRGQPLLVSEDMVKANLEELRAKQAAHILELRTQDGRLVDLQTMEPMPLAPTPPLPHPPLDSVRNDRHQWKYPPGWKFVPPHRPDDATMPNLVPEGQRPQLFTQSDLETAPPSVSTEPPVSETSGSEPVATNAELEAALAGAQGEATEAEGAAPSDTEGVQYGSSRGRRNRR